MRLHAWTWLAAGLLLVAVPCLVAEDGRSEEDRALAALANLAGVHLHRDGPGGPVDEVTLRDTGFTDGLLAHVRHFKHLQLLSIDGADLHDSGLAHVKDLVGMEVLRLRCTKVTDAGLAHLRKLTKLEELDVSGTAVTDAGLAHLRGMTGLRLLDLRSTTVGDAGLKTLPAAKQVRLINVTDTRVSPPPRQDSWHQLGLRPGGVTARVYDANKGTPVGDELSHQGAEPSWVTMKVTCWAFSPDGKLVATGAGFKERGDDAPNNFGDVRVWEIASGELVESWPEDGAIGSVRSVAFLQDGKSVVFEAEPYDIDGP